MSDEAQALTAAIGHRLRAHRQALGLSLTELSERTGGALGKSRISNYEQGIRRMGIEQACLLADALGTISAAQLLFLDDREPYAPEERELIEAYRELSADGRKLIRRAMGCR